MMKFNNEIYKAHEVKDFRDIIKITTQRYPNNVAYKFKKNFKKDNECVVEKTYKEIKSEIEEFSTALLKLVI